MNERLVAQEDLMRQAKVVLGDRIGLGYGAISASERSEAETAELVDAVNHHRVVVDPTAPCGCIDGRNCLHTAAGGPTEPRPKVSGGVTSAYAAAELVGWFGNDSSTQQERFGRINKALLAARIVTGNHGDQHGFQDKFASGKTGCGANDRFVENIDNIYNNPEVVAEFTAALLGDRYQPEAMRFTPGAQGKVAGWQPTIVTDALSEREPSSIEILASDDSPTHGHIEELVVFNFVEGTTIDRDALVAETGRQVLVVDMWYLDKMARALAGGPNARQQYSQLLHGMVAFQIGTYLTLCDGSQRQLILT